MRVLMSRKDRDEQGAVAIMVAAFAIGMCVLAAFVLDFGMAYVNKNQAQSVADAGALTAAKIYSKARATCVGNAVSTPLPLASDPVLEAGNIREAGMPGSKGTLTVTCEGTSEKTVTIRYSVEADSPVGFGALVTGHNTLPVERQAAVRWGTSEKAVGNLRPWALCGPQVPAVLTNDVVAVGIPGHAHQPAASSNCPTDQPGDWWRLRCFGNGGSIPDSIAAIRVGCENTDIVPGQEQTAVSPPEDYLKQMCPSGNGTPPLSTYCLRRDTGGSLSNLAQYWAPLVGQTIAIPVFDPKAFVTNGNWPVWKMAAVTVCGYAMGDRRSPESLPTGECQLGAHGLTPLTAFPDAHDAGFLLIFKGLIQSGGDSAFHVDVKTTLQLVE